MNKWTYAIRDTVTKKDTPIKMGFETILNANQKPVPTGKKITIESVFTALKPTEIFIRTQEGMRKTQKFTGTATMRQWSPL